LDRDPRRDLVCASVCGSPIAGFVASQPQILDESDGGYTPVMKKGRAEYTRAEQAASRCVGQAAQEPSGRVLTRRRAQRLDQEHLDEPRQHEIATGALRSRFITDEAYDRRETYQMISDRHVNVRSTGESTGERLEGLASHRVLL
jgi:hypothetical protein